MNFVSRNTTLLSCQREKGTDTESRRRQQQQATPPNFDWVPSITCYLIHCVFSTPLPQAERSPHCFRLQKVTYDPQTQQTHRRPTPWNSWAAESRITSKPCFAFHSRRLYCSRLLVLETGRLLNYNPKHGRSLAEL